MKKRVTEDDTPFLIDLNLQFVGEVRNELGFLLEPDFRWIDFQAQKQAC